MSHKESATAENLLFQLTNVVGKTTVAVMKLRLKPMLELKARLLATRLEGCILKVELMILLYYMY